MIEEYHFGSITIDGKTYNYDVEVRWAGEVLKWWRRESHIIDVEDIKRVVGQRPEIIVIGNGESGLVEITTEAQKEINLKGIELIIDKTEEAVKTFNVLREKDKKIIGLFHLTC